MTKEIRSIAACVLNDKGDLLAYTCQYSMKACEEFVAKHWPHWDRLKELGCKVVQVEIVYKGDLND